MGPYRSVVLAGVDTVVIIVPAGKAGPDLLPGEAPGEHVAYPAGMLAGIPCRLAAKPPIPDLTRAPLPASPGIDRSLTRRAGQGLGEPLCRDLAAQAGFAQVMTDPARAEALPHLATGQAGRHAVIVQVTPAAQLFQHRVNDLSGSTERRQAARKRRPAAVTPCQQCHGFLPCLVLGHTPYPRRRAPALSFHSVA